MKPRKPLVRRTRLAARTPMKRGGKIKPKPRTADEYRRVYGSKQRVAWVKRRECVVPRCGESRIVGHHTETGGTSYKAGYETIVAICDPHHRELHDNGAETFAEKYCVDLAFEAAQTQSDWLAYQARKSA